MKPKVLIVDDDRILARLWVLELEMHGVDAIVASTIPDARQMFHDNPDLSLIVVDACVPGNRPNTESLVQEFRMTFAGPMIGASSYPSYRPLMIRAGCNHASDKPEMVERIIEVLKEHGLLPAQASDA
ncbi:MAG: hypothetical protein PHH01_01800 [Patescibacteria group bacterium]|nr:hypothetical protein [Patescibacteria group bacterium]